ncbi:hypothetical protein AGMMS50230_12380 [Spirochaetia bacterium]|nr:hypothetical protein AGMMS50230_12380 [Spirochaetia bacterium]
MAISPIDLQTLFTQMDKVGKQEAAQREGAALLQSIQQAKNQEQTDERIRSVNEAQNTGEGTEGIKDKNGGRAGEEGQHHREAKEENADEPEAEHIIRDPDLGKNIDLSL